MTSSSDMEMLAATAIELAKENLERDGRFDPFGVTIPIDHDDNDDELDVVEAGSDEGQIDEEQALDALVGHFTENKGNFRAVAVAFDAEMDEEWDAITVLVAHSSGMTIDVQEPYRTSGRKRIWGETEQTPGSLEIWS